MIGILVVTHGHSASDMVATLRRLMGDERTRGFEGLDVEVGEAKSDIRRRLHDAVARIDDGEGVLICADLHGATPTNCALEEMRESRNMAVVAGVNLPMLMKLATANRTGLSPESLARGALDTAIRSIRLEGCR
ncbi:MAG TPA: PTS sugar transporter subunit IIA [Haliangiales bacterium]|nr:PTS sugar transporter subunit IIA [Haliangiales bacterium]